MPLQIHYLAIVLNLLAGAGLLVLLCLHTSVSWRMVRTRATTRHHVLHTTRQRLLPGIWVVLCAFAATSLFGEVGSAAMHLPNVWQVTTTTADKRGYALLALGGYLFVSQILLGLSALTRGPRPSSAKRAHEHQHGGSDLAAALTSSAILAATLFAVLAMATLGYLQLLAHTAA
jgi:hypothetical protein